MLFHDDSEPTQKISSDWLEYYEIKKNKAPSDLLLQALEYVDHHNKAIDIGGGILQDTRYLLDHGFHVTVVDKDILTAKEAKTIQSDKLCCAISLFEDFNFPKNEYDIASASYALPYNPPESFETVFANIKQSLVSGGVFCANLFGVRDEWSVRSNMTFHTAAQVKKLLSDMQVILFIEDEERGKTVDGTPKHWHLFHFIAKKI